MEVPEVMADAPYAYIGDPAKLHVESPKKFSPIPGNNQRWALKYSVEHCATGVKFPVILIHSPSSTKLGLPDPPQERNHSPSMYAPGGGSAKRTAWRVTAHVGLGR